MLEEIKKVLAGIRTDTEKVVRSLTENHLRCARYDVTTAPNGSVIGVTQPFGSSELKIPYSWMCSQAAVGDTVIVVWWGSLSNAQAWFMGDGWVSKVLPIYAGGTGGTNASEAKANLGLSQNFEMIIVSAANNMGAIRWTVGNTSNARSGHSISLNFLDEGLSLYDGTTGEQLIGISYPLSVARGGTGQTSLAGVQSAFGIAYASGDTETINNVTPLSGYGYSSTVAVFTVPVSKSMVNISSVSVTAMQGLLMGVTGLLEGSSNNYNWLTNSAYTVTAQIASPGIVRLRLQKSSAFSYTVDTPLIFAPSTLTLSFS